MTEQEIRDWLKENLDAKLKEFGLLNWRIETLFARLDRDEDGFQAFMSVPRRFEYERATIKIDLNACSEHLDNDADFIEFIEHEIMHIVHSPMNLAQNIVWEFLEEKERRVWNEAWRQAQELTVRNMERMTHGLRQTLTDRHKEQFDAVCNEKAALEARVAELEAQVLGSEKGAV